MLALIRIVVVVYKIMGEHMDGILEHEE